MGFRVRGLGLGFGVQVLGFGLEFWASRLETIGHSFDPGMCGLKDAVGYRALSYVQPKMATCATGMTRRMTMQYGS